MKYFNKNYKNQAWMIGANLLLMGFFFLLCFAAEGTEFDPKFPDNFTTLPWYVGIFGSFILSSVLMNVIFFNVNRFKSVRICYFVSAFLSIVSVLTLIITLGTAVNSAQGVTLDTSRVLTALVGCVLLNVPLTINMLFNTCLQCFHYRSIAKTGEGREKITEYVKGWTEKRTVGTVKDIYGNIVMTAEQEIYHPGHSRTVSEHFNMYTCFVCGNKTRD